MAKRGFSGRGFKGSKIFTVTLDRKGAKNPRFGTIRAKNNTAAKKTFSRNLLFTRNKKAEKQSVKAAKATGK